MPITVSVVGGLSFSIDAESATIGSDPSCTIRLDDPRVRPHHALLRYLGGRWMIESQGGDELRIGAEPPAKIKWLRPGDTVELTASGPQLVFEPHPLPHHSAQVPGDLGHRMGAPHADSLAGSHSGSHLGSHAGHPRHEQHAPHPAPVAEPAVARHNSHPGHHHDRHAPPPLPVGEPAPHSAHRPFACASSRAAFASESQPRLH